MLTNIRYVALMRCLALGVFGATSLGVTTMNVVVVDAEDA
jgi:hypothetical protein